MDSIIGFIGLILRAPFWLLGTVLAAIWAIGFGGLSALWFFVCLPIVWILLGVPAAFFAVSFKGGGRASEQLSRRLKSERDGWRSSWKWHFHEIGSMFTKLNRWLLQGSSRRY